jgi:spore coat polysaccharide biosynthesis protein SpsF (cytidylyltransferase family)
MTNIIAFVQARMSSTRLPGKVLKPLGSKTAVGYVFHHLAASKKLSKAVLVTSTDRSDDPLVAWAKRSNVECERGSLKDVLDRYYHAAKAHHADIVVRITADCPLIDAEVVDSVIDRFLQGDCDYCSNVNPPTFPDGLDTEVVSFEALETSWKEASHPVEREHVTLYIRNYAKKFRLANVENIADFSKLRWTLDTQQDYDFLNRVIQHLEMKHIRETHPRFHFRDVLEVLQEDKSLLEINQHIQRNEGYFSSLPHDYVAKL